MPADIEAMTLARQLEGENQRLMAWPKSMNLEYLDDYWTTWQMHKTKLDRASHVLSITANKDFIRMFEYHVDVLTATLMWGTFNDFDKSIEIARMFTWRRPGGRPTLNFLSGKQAAARSATGANRPQFKRKQRRTAAYPIRQVHLPDFR